MSIRLGLFLFVCLSACGYSVALRLPEGQEDIGVEIFVNDSDLRDLERDLYDEMSSSVLNLVRAPLVSPGRADVVVRGRILEYRRRSGVRNPRNRLLETGVLITVEAELWDKRNSVTLGRPITSKVEIGYVVGEPIDPLTSIDSRTTRNRELELTNEREARARALRILSEQVVLDLFTTIN